MVPIVWIGCKPLDREPKVVERGDRQILVGRLMEREGSEFRRALDLHRSGRVLEAITLYRKILTQCPAYAEVYASLGDALKAIHRLEDAIMAYKQAISLKPDIALVHFLLGESLKASGRREEAITALQEAIRRKPDFAAALNSLGTLLFEGGDARGAQSCWRRAIAIQPDFAEAFNNLGAVLKSQGDHANAEQEFLHALALRPDYAQAHNNLGSLYYEQGRLERAQECFTRALNIKPDYVEAIGNLASVDAEQGAFEKAIDGYRRALAMAPDFLHLYNQLALTLCKVNRSEAGFEWYLRGARLSAQRSCGDARHDPPHRLRHDKEQLAYLSKHGIPRPSRGSIHLQSQEKIWGPTIQTRDVRDIEDQWHNTRPQIVVIDDFLTQEALMALRQFCLGSTIWQESFSHGYLGARPETGFSSPLLAQIAEELRLAYPQLFGSHALMYAWAFKYDSKLGGTRVHADFAAINVNFWITPDSANLDPESGGLVIWDVAAPLEWNSNTYNTDEKAIRLFLQRERAKPITIPYRSNRAVIFDSDLFHETDRMSFADGYENRRINITFLYGTREC